MMFKKKLLGIIIVVVSLMTVVSLSGLNFLTLETRTDADLTRTNADSERESATENMEKIFFTTKDGVKISAVYRNVDLSKYPEPRGSIVFLHMMPATKESWNNLAEEFQNIGYEGIAIDFRGHGESDGGPTGYQNFSDEEQRKKIFDVEAAVNYLKGKGAASDKISLMGASIGANLSIQYMSEHPEFRTAVALSPGTNYFSINTVEFVKKLRTGQKLFLVGAKDDDRVPTNAKETQAIYNAVAPEAKKEIKIYDTGGHGTVILERQPELRNLIIGFIQPQ